MDNLDYKAELAREKGKHIELQNEIDDLVFENQELRKELEKLTKENEKLKGAKGNDKN